MREEFREELERKNVLLNDVLSVEAEGEQVGLNERNEDIELLSTLLDLDQSLISNLNQKLKNSNSERTTPILNLSETSSINSIDLLDFTSVQEDLEMNLEGITQVDNPCNSPFLQLQSMSPQIMDGPIGSQCDGVEDDGILTKAAQIHQQMVQPEVIHKQVNKSLEEKVDQLGNMVANIESASKGSK